MKVFTELSEVFMRMINEWYGKPKDEKFLENFLSSYTDGPSEEDGQTNLKEAVKWYYYAMYETDEKRKAEMMLLANATLSIHEQTRLQPQVHLPSLKSSLKMK
jgi:hypothetical protein